MPREALFLASKVFQRYRTAGAIQSRVKTGFFIRAHVLVTDLPLLTRDIQRYRTYFPAPGLIAPPRIVSHF